MARVLNAQVPVSAGVYLCRGMGAVLFVEGATVGMRLRFLTSDVAVSTVDATSQDGRGMWWRLSPDTVDGLAAATVVQVLPAVDDLPVAAGPVVWTDGRRGLTPQRVAKVRALTVGLVPVSTDTMSETAPGSGLYVLN